MATDELEAVKEAAHILETADIEGYSAMMVPTETLRVLVERSRRPHD